MKPGLIVDGKIRKVTSVNFYDGTQPTVMVEGDEGILLLELESDKVGDLVLEDRHKPVVDVLNAHLEESEQHLLELKNKIAYEVLATDIGNLPYSELEIFLATLKDLSKEHHDHNQYIDGVAASIEYVKGLKSEVDSVDE